MPGLPPGWELPHGWQWTALGDVLLLTCPQGHRFVFSQQVSPRVVQETVQQHDANCENLPFILRYRLIPLSEHRDAPVNLPEVERTLNRLAAEGFQVLLAIDTNPPLLLLERWYEPDD